MVESCSVNEPLQRRPCGVMADWMSAFHEKCLVEVEAEEEEECLPFRGGGRRKRFGTK